MTFLAVIAVALAVGTWVGIRWAETSHRIQADVTTYLVSIPADEWQK